MKFTAILLSTGMALLMGCVVYSYPPTNYQPPQNPQYGYNSPAPIVEPLKPEVELQLLISNKKVEFISSDTASISFTTNVPAISNVKLIGNEVIVSTQQITDKVTYHYYKFTGLKQLIHYFVAIESEANSKDSSVMDFYTSGNIEPTPKPYPPFYFFPTYPQ